MVTDNERLAQAIKLHMRDRNWNLADLAAVSGIPPRRLSERLTGLTDYKLSEMSALAEAFGVTLHELVLEPTQNLSVAA